ncbi:MAG: Mannosyl-glycoprotein endo-beta-N-acetylglucosaminidase [Acidimicrobiales bacterium]|nr:Mannosyl-glycoprotein endo-beta-N-acetylglucosaminidase [Acidimicrobiales bacterium]
MHSTRWVAASATAPNRTRRRLARTVSLAVAILVLAPAVSAHAANADPTPTATTPTPAVPAAPDDAIARLARAETALNTTAFDLQGAQATLTRLRARQRAAEAQRARAASTTQQRAGEVHAAEAVLTVRQAAVAIQLRSLQRLAVESFVAGNDSALDQLRALLNGDTTDQHGRTVTLSGEVFAHEGGELRKRQAAQAVAEQELSGARSRLADARTAQQAAQGAANKAAAATRQQVGVRDDAQRRHDAALADRTTALAQLRLGAFAPPGTVPLTTPILGAPRLTAEDLAGWFASSAYRPRIPTPIADFARWFIEEGRQEGVRGDIAFAQAVLETGGFANTDSVVANNYSGIGHCDTCAGGWVFPSPQLGVRAQIQLLKSYAELGATYVNPLVDPRLHGPAGCCPTWGDLTRKWATAPTYGPMVIGIYAQMVAFALRRHAAMVGA